MYHVSSKRGAVAVLVLTLGLAACEDKRVKELNTGISRDSAVTVLAQEIKGTGHDPLPNVYSSEQYLQNGKNYEVLYFAPSNKKFPKDTVAWKLLTPIVFADNKLVGKGWPAWDSISTSLHIPLRDHSK
jgi:hypothetical protein